jgi:hypothetical protein
MPPGEPERRVDRIVLLLLLGLLAFVSPLRAWWASGYAPWFTPYALWALIIALVAWSQGSRGSS